MEYVIENGHYVYKDKEGEKPLDRTRVGMGNGRRWKDLGSRSYQPQGIGATRSDDERTKKDIGNSDDDQGMMIY